MFYIDACLLEQYILIYVSVSEDVCSTRTVYYNIILIIFKNQPKLFKAYKLMNSEDMP